MASNEENVENKLAKLWISLNKKPKCVVVDLDYTIWPFILDSNVLPPIRQVIDTNNNKVIFDHRKKRLKLYESVEQILKKFKQFENVYLAIASRSTAHDQAIELLEMLNILHYFDSVQIYSGSKLKHLRQIKSDLNKIDKELDFKQILFFDDNKSNLEQTSQLGVVGHQVRRHYGLSVDEFLNGLDKFSLGRI